MNGHTLQLSLLLALPTAAQAGVIVGTVSHATTKQPVAGVVVTATAPDMPGEQVVVTDAEGGYFIPVLPSGTYSLRFEKEHFQPYSRSGLALGEGRALRVTVELLPTGLDETVVIAFCRGTLIDVGSTAHVVNVGQDLVRFVPLSSGR